MKKRRRPSERSLPNEPPPKRKRVYGKRDDPKEMKNGLTPGNPGNSGGKPGRSGRTPLAFKRFCMRMTMGKNSQRALRRIFRIGDMHPEFMNALKWASSHGYGMPKQAMDLTATVSLEDLLTKAAELERDDSDE